MDFITNRAIIDIGIVIIGIHLNLSFQIGDFDFYDAKEAAKTTTATALTLFHTIYHRIRFSRARISPIWVICTNVCVCVRACLRPFTRYPLLVSLSISSHITHTYTYAEFSMLHFHELNLNKKSWCFINWSSAVMGCFNELRKTLTKPNRCQFWLFCCCCCCLNHNVYLSRNQSERKRVCGRAER